MESVFEQDETGSALKRTLGRSLDWVVREGLPREVAFEPRLA